jgi:hypothetical protein
MIHIYRLHLITRIGFVMATELLHAGLYSVASGARVEMRHHLTVLLSPFPATTVTNQEPDYSFLGLT